MKQIVRITKALADPQRVRALLALKRHELCVCQIIALLKLAPSTVSKHMQILYRAKLVETRQEGRWIYYRVPDHGSPHAVRDALKWIVKHLKDDPLIQEDRKRLKRILKMDPSVLCKQQQNTKKS